MKSTQNKMKDLSSCGSEKGDMVTNRVNSSMGSAQNQGDLKELGKTDLRDVVRGSGVNKTMNRTES